MKLTEQDIDARISTIDYSRIPGTTTTICIIKLINGFVLTGQSACIDMADFDTLTGKDMAYKDARAKIWELEGYRACEERYQAMIRETRELFAPETRGFEQKVEQDSISDILSALFKTPINAFRPHDAEFVASCWNRFEGDAARVEQFPWLHGLLRVIYANLHSTHSLTKD